MDILRIKGYILHTKATTLVAFVLIVLGFNDTSTLEGHFVSSPREREKRDRRESRGDEREGQGRKRNRNESEETEEIKTFPSTLTHYKDSRPCPTVSQYQLDAPVMKDTQHLCTTRPPPWLLLYKSYLPLTLLQNSLHMLQTNN